MPLDGAPPSTDLAAEPVAVVVASRDRPDRLDTCLRSVRVSLRPGDELIVVDSASHDRAAVARVAAAHAATLLRAEQPGVNLARNVGWRATTASLVLFTDDDVTVEPGWADAYRTGIGPAAFATGWVGAPEGSAYRVAVKDDERTAVLERSTRPTLGHGASTAVRREALERVGGWDELLGAGARFRSAPESDLYDRLLQHGLTGVYLPTARAWHAQWRTDRQVAALQVRYSVGMGARLAKLLRHDRARLRHAVREALWDWGVVALVTSLRQGDLPRSAAAVVRFGGYAFGFAAALGTPVVDGHFRTGRAAGSALRRPSRDG